MTFPQATETETFADLSELPGEAELPAEDGEATFFAEADADADTDAEGADDLDDDSPAGHSGGRARKQITKQSAAKAIAKYVELSQAPAEHIEMLAAAIGGRSDAADLAAAIVSSARVNLAPINDLFSLADATATSPYAAMLEAMKLDRDQVKQVWTILVAAGVVKGAIPSKESAAAVAVAEASAKIGDRERTLFQSVRTLARK